MALKVCGDRKEHIGPQCRGSDGGVHAHHQFELLDRLDFLVDVGQLVEPVRAMPEDRLDVGDPAVEFVVPRPAADLFPPDVGVVEHAVRPAIRLDRGIPDVGILVIGVRDGLGVPALADTLGTAAEDADVAGHRLQGCRHPVVLLTITGAPRRPARLERGRLGPRVHFGQFLDVDRGNPANLFGPFRRLRNALVLAEDVVLEVLLVGELLGRRTGVHALAEFVDELLVLPVVGEDMMSHAGQHGGVGIGLDRDPPGVVAGGGIGVLRVDDDKLAAALLGQAHVVKGIAAVEGIRRVPAPHDNQLAVREGIVFIAVGDGAKGRARAEGRPLVAGHRPRVGAATEHAEETGEQAFDLV